MASLQFARECADELKLSIQTVHADALQRLPFSDALFDCVWSSGLLEHFDPKERRSMLAEQARISRGIVIALVPNAACLAYRLGKEQQETEGTWPYGIETPQISLSADFNAAGMKVIAEKSIGCGQGLSFLPHNDPLRKILTQRFALLPPHQPDEWNQGYLLMTIGTAE
jgi:SAM-dependent methyltransferase